MQAGDQTEVFFNDRLNVFQSAQSQGNPLYCALNLDMCILVIACLNLPLHYHLPSETAISIQHAGLMIRFVKKTFSNLKKAPQAQHRFYL